MSSVPLTSMSRLPFHKGWLVALGSISVVLGILALVLPVSTSIGLAWLMGALFLVSGIAQLVQAFRFTKESGAFSRFLLSALAIIAGIIVLRNPAVGMMAITLVLAFYFFMAAVGRWLLASELRPMRGWGWLFFSSVVSFLLGVVLLVTFPVSSLFIPALLLGIDLIAAGSGLIAFAFALRQIERTTKELPPSQVA